jgi:bacillithiol biosynthesis deacetylase BshB1
MPTASSGSTTPPTIQVHQALDVLLLAPHPDDAEICCGGLVLLATRAGKRVGILDVSRGEAGTRGSGALRAEEAKAASAALGLHHRENLGFPDGRLSEVEALADAIVRAVRRLRPALLLAPFPRDLHPDHEAVGQATRRAFYLSGVRRHLPEAPPHRPARLFHYMEHHRFRPSFVLDISQVWEPKVAAIRCYASQLEPAGEGHAHLPAGLDILQRIEVRDRYYGTWVGAAYGEPYVSEAPVRVRDPFDLV